MVCLYENKVLSLGYVIQVQSGKNPKIKQEHVPSNGISYQPDNHSKLLESLSHNIICITPLMLIVDKVVEITESWPLHIVPSIVYW